MAISFRSLAATLFLVAVVGCAPGSKLKTVPVTGKVTFKNEPLAGATVAFVQEAQAGQVARTATGTTDAQGAYKLISFETPSKPVDGVVPGKYMVIVTKAKAATGGAQAMMQQGLSEAERLEKMKNMSGQDISKMGMQSGGVPIQEKTGASSAEMSESMKALQSQTEIPERYSHPDQSKLTADVKDGGAQTFDFALEE